MPNRNLMSQWSPWNWLRNENNPSSYSSSSRSDLSRNLPASYFGPIANFYRDMDQMLDTVMNNFGFGSLAKTGLEDVFRPRINIAASEREYIITVEAPGVNEEDIRLELIGNNLIIRGEKRQESQEEAKDFFRVESSYGSFQRSVSLPDDIELDEISATCESGLLTIFVPRREQSRSQRREIEVNAEGGRRRARERSREGGRESSREYSSSSKESQASQSSQGKKAA